MKLQRVVATNSHLGYSDRAELSEFALISTPFGVVVGCVREKRIRIENLSHIMPDEWGDYPCAHEVAVRRVPAVCHTGNPYVPARDDWRFTPEWINRLWQNVFRHFEDLPDSTPFVQDVSPWQDYHFGGMYVPYGNRRARWFTTLGAKRREWAALRADGREVGNPDTNPRC